MPLCGEVVCDQPNAELCVDGVCVCDPELHQSDDDNGGDFRVALSRGASCN